MNITKCKYPILKLMIQKKGLDIKDICKVLGMSTRTFHNKMSISNNNDFSWTQTGVIQKSFFPEIDKEKLFSDEIPITKSA